jgi:imidazolonepropionase-like amidohydrolase
MAEKGVYYCPTLGVTHDEAYMRRWEWPEHSIRRALDGAALHRRSFQAALREGVQIVNGADRNPIADTAVDELEWHVRAGASCAHTLLGSTRRAADLWAWGQHRRLRPAGLTSSQSIASSVASRRL